MTHRFALVRTPSPSLVDALRQEPGPPIDFARAREQHSAYVAALQTLGLAIMRLPELPACPDACFVEDTAVIYRDAALVTRPGAPSRRHEVETVAQTLAAIGLEVVRMPAPATLDGGDVMRVGDVFYVGRSARTNDAGIALLEAFARAHGASVRVVPLPPGVLHLKCHASALAVDTVLAVQDLPLALAPHVRRLDLPRQEAFAANAVASGAGVVLAAHHPRAVAIVSDAGFYPRVVDTSELAKADGSLTCMSLIVDRAPR